LAFGKEVTVVVRDTDRYGRTVAVVILPDGRNLNHELVKRGYAWWYRKYASHDRIWSGWRKMHGRLSAGYGAILMRSRLGSIGSV
jgi:endonuclease YncB( thermonuclease family)